MISEVELNRDKGGFFTHPDLLEWDEMTPTSVIERWLSNNNIKINFVMFEDTASEDLVEQWFEHDLSDCSEWDPTKHMPEGALVLAIYDTEEAPCCLYAIPYTDNHEVDKTQFFGEDYK